MLKQLRWGRFCSIWEVSHWEYRMNRTGSFDNWICYQILLIKPMREYELILARFQNSRDLNIYPIACSFRWMLGIPQCIRFINLCQSGLVIVMDVNTSLGKKREIRDEANRGQAKKGEYQTVLCWRFLLSMHLSFQKNYFSVLYSIQKANNIILKSCVSSRKDSTRKLHCQVTKIAGLLKTERVNFWLKS